MGGLSAALGLSRHDDSRVRFEFVILLKLVMKGNNSDVMEVPELGSELCTWLQLVCCALTC